MKWRLLEAAALGLILFGLMHPQPGMLEDQKAFMAGVIALGFVGVRNRLADLAAERRRIKAMDHGVVVKRNGVWVSATRHRCVERSDT